MSSSHTRSATAGDPSRWTRLHILLHWTVLGLVMAQYASGGWMSEAFRASLDGGNDASALAYFAAPFHMAIGATLFLAIAARIWDRLVHGRPPHPSGEPRWAQWLARITQILLYLTVLAMPVAGALAWFRDDGQLASLHAIAAKVLFALIALHAAGALANHYWFKTDVLRRMLPGQGRDAARGRSARKPTHD